MPCNKDRTFAVESLLDCIAHVKIRAYSFIALSIALTSCDVSDTSTMNDKPELRQYSTLTLEDFARQPVWVACHTEDYDQP